MKPDLLDSNADSEARDTVTQINNSLLTSEDDLLQQAPDDNVRHKRRIYQSEFDISVGDKQKQRTENPVI